MTRNKRYEPDPNQTIDALIDDLSLHNDRLLDIVKRTANINTAVGGDSSLQTDAIKLLKDLGEIET